MDRYLKAQLRRRKKRNKQVDRDFDSRTIIISYFSYLAAEKALRSLNEPTISLSDNTTNELVPISSKMIAIDTSMMSKTNIPSDDIDRLLQLQPDVQFEEITTEEFDHQFIVRFRDQSFVGVHKSKELAKAKAMQLALDNLLAACPDRKGKALFDYKNRFY